MKIQKTLRKRSTNILLIFILGLFLASCSTTDQDVSAKLANAILLSTDLPLGYQGLSEENLQDLGMSREKFSDSFGGMSVDFQPVSFNAFMNPNANNIGMVFVMVIYPLSRDDIRAWDEQIQNAEIAANDLSAGMGEGVVLVPKNEFVGIGNGSMGFITTIEGLNVEIILARRNDAAMLLMSEYMQSGVDIFALAQLLDERVAAAYQ